MYDSKEDEPNGPSVPGIGNFESASFFFLGSCKQDDTSSKQHAKNSPHGALDKQVVHEEDPQVPTGISTMS